jgi:hypothetical protein
MKGTEMDFNAGTARTLLGQFEFAKLFVEELGWDRHGADLSVPIAGTTFALRAVAEKRGLVAWVCQALAGQQIPDRATRKKIETQVAKTTLEHIIIFTDAKRAEQIWCWARREAGKPASFREHFWLAGASNRPFLQKLERLFVSFEEEAALTLPGVLGRASAAFDVEKVTKKFYDQFKAEHKAFLDFIGGITDVADKEWYASLMLNRLMFIYFMQRKRFLDNKPNYLTDKLVACKAQLGKDKFYSFYRTFLLRLFHEGLGGKARNPELDKLFGRIPYLNGGLFEKHPIEERCSEIKIPDGAFTRIFAFFDRYQWHLDERPLRDDNEINPDVLGYIFEKYINQKQMGAYYTKEDITEYISKNTVIPFLFDAAKAECKVAFENPGGPTIWDHLRDDPERYIYPAVKHGITWDIRTGTVLETALELPPEIAAGIEDVSARTQWNQKAQTDFGLPTEIWREVVARRTRYAKVRAKLAAGEVREINDLITLNLDIRQFAQDVIERCEGPELLRAFWKAIARVTVLDPTCGSGAFLFAALNILEPLYETCLDRMEAFVADRERSSGKVEDNPKGFRDVLKKIEAHPNARYFTLKSIILNNLFGVDIMEEAVEICKLRLFLKLAAQVDPDQKHENLGIEPLPDIDFNIRAGNTLVGYATYDEVENAQVGKFEFDNSLEKIADSAAELQQIFDAFRDRQIDGDNSVPTSDKLKIRHRLNALKSELDRHLATDYGVNPSDAAACSKWALSHHPFHWFIEFYGIMRDGGFDVVLGNPPYLEYSKVSDYTVRGYSTARCANLYAYTVERSFALCGGDGRIAMIVPISIACSGAMAPLRTKFSQSGRSSWLSHFSNRPGQLFNGAQNRLSIFLTSARNTQAVEFSTRYHRWDARNGERENLFAALRYEGLGKNSSIFHGLLPKVGNTEAANVVEKLRNKKSVSIFSTKQGAQKIYWVRVPGYFCQFLIAPPMARPENGGPARLRGEVNSIGFNAKSSRDVVHAILNSSIYYLFFCVYTDTRHINPSDVSEFPIDLDAIRGDLKSSLEELSHEVAGCNTTYTAQRRKSGLLIDSVDSRPCKPILDRIDQVLAEHFGLTEEELDFVVNYDIKYRLGGGAESEGSE